VETPEVYQRGGDAKPFSNSSNTRAKARCKKDMIGPLRTSGTSMWAPIARGQTCKMYVGHVPARDGAFGLRKRDGHQLRM
jgi:hypothetical protein